MDTKKAETLLKQKPSAAEPQSSPQTEGHSLVGPSQINPSSGWKKPRRGRISGAEAKRRRKAREEEARAAAAAHSSEHATPPLEQPTHIRRAEQPRGVPPSGRKAEHPKGLPPQKRVDHLQDGTPKKRNRSGTSSEATPRDPKRARQGPGPGAAPPISYREAALSHLRVAIIDKDNPYGKMSKDREVLVKRTLGGELDKIILSTPAPDKTIKPPTFRSWTYAGEIIRVFCEDEYTLGWLTDTVGGLRPWEGASLAVVPVDKLPRLTKATLWIPLEAESDHEEKEVVVRRLAGQNPMLSVGKWCVFHHEAKVEPRGHLLVFGIGDEDMETLRARSMRVNYIFQSLTLKARPDRPAEQVDAEVPPTNVQPPLEEHEQATGGMEMDTEVAVEEAGFSDGSQAAASATGTEPSEMTFDMMSEDLAKMVHPPLITEEMEAEMQ